MISMFGSNPAFGVFQLNRDAFGAKSTPAREDLTLERAISLSCFKAGGGASAVPGCPDPAIAAVSPNQDQIKTGIQYKG